MQLTDGERLIVVMLADLMEGLKIKREVDPALIRSLAYNGDDWAIRRKYSGLFDNEPPSSEEVTETADILWMWGIIESSIANLTGADAEEAKSWYATEFGGFDGNNDRHHGIARTLISELGDFESFKDRGLNSHSQASLPRYRAMYEKFCGYVDAGQAAPLSIDALRDLLG